MNIIITNLISDPNYEQGFTGLSLAFLQNATKEIVAATIQSMVGDVPVANQPYALYGCIKSGSGPYSYTTGYIYYNGEVYLFPAVGSIAIATSDICTITISNDGTADPVPFSDGTNADVHNHRTLVVSDHASVTNNATQFNFSSVIYFQPKILTIGSAGSPAFKPNFTVGSGVTLKLWKDIFGYAHLQGAFTSTSAAGAGNVNTAVFDFPAGYQPLDNSNVLEFIGQEIAAFPTALHSFTIDNTSFYLKDQQIAAYGIGHITWKTA